MNNVMKLTAFLYYSTLWHRENVLIFSPKLKSNLTNRKKKNVCIIKQIMTEEKKEKNRCHVKISAHKKN